MIWVTPSVGLLVAAITFPLLLLLYFLRLRRQPVRIASTMLWHKAVEDLHANSPFQRLHVLLRCAVGASLVHAAPSPGSALHHPLGQQVGLPDLRSHSACSYRVSWSRIAGAAGVLRP